MQSPSHDIQLELIDMIIELVTRYGLPAAADASATLLSAIQQYLLALFSHSRVTVRKRAAVALGNVSVFFSDALFDASVEAVVAQVKSAMEASDLAALKTWIPALGFLRWVMRCDCS